MTYFNGTELRSMLLAAGLLDAWRTLAPPPPSLTYTTAAAFMDRVAESSTQWPTLRGERPNVWAYIHGPSHHHAITASREGQIALTQAETFSTVGSLSELVDQKMAS